ncbi:isocitrate lyase/phosphoenolpyruvate mutase family protein [Amaricoccus sp.]|uniref:isocitrate lyase/PEP mutase family protein n=1 Tax=Amaricoccus sp. TaxID=1872485 RepID=UPI001B69AAE6|nr:isocitrate lyase/phosphoenolpyruvate mutase family protein [Amaricoccus sp.]MBP7000526.1 isocitrate lyase/phosphoenolpyruvate mutase family protein [Amaricoccus sp.]
MTADVGAALRALHRPGDPFVLANAWDRGSARVLAALGAQAIGTTSAGFAFTRGLPDGARVTLDETLAHCAEIVAATSLPVSGDLENGFAEAPDGVAATVRRAAEAGLAGCSIEDTDLPGDGAYAFFLAVERVRAAAAAARALPRDFVLVARADGLMTGAYALKEAVSRARAFTEAGADCVYVPMLPDLAAVATFCTKAGVPVNVLTAGPLAAATRAELAQAGAARISLGSGLARVAQAAFVAAAREVLDEGRFTALARGAKGAEIDALLARGAGEAADPE